MYFQKKRCIAMLLAGGQGSRLKVLTEKTAKPAVPFGGKYRIIDFPLSNCVNSGIDTVGILTQYQPLELNEYIGNGQPWGLNKTHSCAQVLPPYERHDKKSGWYKGTANAIYQNITFLDQYDPDYVLILSGDQSPLLSEEGDTVFDHYRCVAFGKWVAGLIDDLARLTPPATQDEQRRTQGVLPASFDESVYVFCRNYFALPSFSAVEDLTVGEYVMAKKDAYNIAVVDRNTAAEIRKGTKR